MELLVNCPLWTYHRWTSFDVGSYRLYTFHTFSMNTVVVITAAVRTCSWELRSLRSGLPAGPTADQRMPTSLAGLDADFQARRRGCGNWNQHFSGLWRVIMIENGEIDAWWTQLILGKFISIWPAHSFSYQDVILFVNQTPSFSSCFRWG